MFITRITIHWFMNKMVVKGKYINIADAFSTNINMQVAGKVLDNFEFWFFTQIAVL